MYGRAWRISINYLSRSIQSTSQMSGELLLHYKTRTTGTTIEISGGTWRILETLDEDMICK